MRLGLRTARRRTGGGTRGGTAGPMRLVLMALTLFAFWLLLSGHYTLWLTASGAVLAVLVTLFSAYKGIVDEEGFPIEKLPRALVYWPWLGLQMARSALNVARLIVDPKLPISPTMVRVRAKQRTAVGLTTYANSITLTPGTISVEVSERGRAVWVHCITRENAEGFTDDAMNDRVAWMDGVSEPEEDEAQIAAPAPAPFAGGTGA